MLRLFDSIWQIGDGRLADFGHKDTPGVERRLAQLERQRRQSRALAVGKREAARLLGVDRTKTLEPLLASGAVRTVLVNGRTRIPRDELQRLVEHGLPRPRAKAPRPAKKARATPLRRSQRAARAEAAAVLAHSVE